MTEGHHWDGYNHQTLYGMIHGTPPGGLRGLIAKLTGQELAPGAGVSGAAGALDGWGELAALMEEARAETDAALADAGASWEGAAAESMRSGVTPLAQWAADSNTAGTASQSSVDEHVASFSGAQHRMPEPVPVTSTANSDYGGVPAGFIHLFGGQTDQDKQEAAAREAKAEAVRVMSGYEGQSTLARSSVGTFVPPPSVTVQVASPTPTGGETGSFGGRFAGPPGGSPNDPRTRSGADSAGADRVAPTTGDSQATTPEQAAPVGEAKPTPVAPPEQVTPKPGPPQTPFPPVGPGPRIDPVTGRPTGGGARAPSARGPGGVPGGNGESGRGGSGPGRGVAGGPGAGGATGSGPVAERATGARGAGPGGARAGGGMGTGPMGAAGRGQGEEDTEHRSPAYLQDSHDSFWEGGIPPVVAPVIGAEQNPE